MGNAGAKVVTKVASSGGKRLPRSRVLEARKAMEGAETSRVPMKSMQEAAASGWLPEKDTPEKAVLSENEELDTKLLEALKDVGPLDKVERTEVWPKAAPEASELPRSPQKKTRTMPSLRTRVEPTPLEAIPAVEGRLTEAQAFGVLRAFRTPDTRELEEVLKEHSAKTGVPVEKLRLLEKHLQYPRIVVNNVDDKFAAFEPVAKPLKAK